MIKTINAKRTKILLGYLSGSISVGVLFFILFAVPALLWFGVVVVFLLLGWFRKFLKTSRSEYLLLILQQVAPDGMTISEFHEDNTAPQWLSLEPLPAGIISYDNTFSGSYGEIKFDAVDVKVEQSIQGGRGARRTISLDRYLGINGQSYKINRGDGFYVDLLTPFSVKDQQRFQDQLDIIVDWIKEAKH